MRHGRGRRGHLLHQLREIGARDQHPCFRLHQHRGKLRRHQARVERVTHRPHAHDGVPRLDMRLRVPGKRRDMRSEEHTSVLQSLLRISYPVFCLKTKKQQSLMTHTYTALYSTKTSNTTTTIVAIITHYNNYNTQNS